MKNSLVRCLLVSALLALNGTSLHASTTLKCKNKLLDSLFGSQQVYFNLIIAPKVTNSDLEDFNDKTPVTIHNKLKRKVQDNTIIGKSNTQVYAEGVSNESSLYSVIKVYKNPESKTPYMVITRKSNGNYSGEIYTEARNISLSCNSIN